MKNNFLYFIAAIILFSVPGLYAKEWNILVYMNGDNDVEPLAIKDINAMERGINPSLMNVVVQLDRAPGYDSSNGDWQNVKRFELVSDTNSDNTIRSTEIANLAEILINLPSL